MERVAIFVDVQNVYYTSRQTYRKNFDYNAFWRKATAKRQVVTAYAYAVERGDTKQREFQNILRAIGFEVKLKPFIQRADGSAKGSSRARERPDSLAVEASRCGSARRGG